MKLFLNSAILAVINTAMEVICLEDPAFYKLIEVVVERLKEKPGNADDKWITDEEAKRMLGIKSKTTMQNLRNEGKIRFSQPQRKIILYDRESILSFLENNANQTF